MLELLTTQKNLWFKKIPTGMSFIGLFLLIIGPDQIYKQELRHGDGFYLCNKGISFGINLPNSLFWLTLVVFLIFLISFLLYFYKKVPHSAIFLAGLGLFIGGILSNLVDRIFFGCVFDYIVFFKKSFFVFNLADLGIFLGTCLLLIALMQKKPSVCA